MTAGGCRTKNSTRFPPEGPGGTMTKMLKDVVFAVLHSYVHCVWSFLGEYLNYYRENGLAGDLNLMKDNTDQTRRKKRNGLPRDDLVMPPPNRVCCQA